MKQHLLLVSILTAFWPATVVAEQDSFAIMLGGVRLGTLTFDQDYSTSVLRSTMDNTPFRIADGTFQAVSRTNGNVLSYQGVSSGSRERDITFIREADTITSVTILPTSEMTELSDAANVPTGVISPNEFFADLMNDGTCPVTRNIFDGRRVVQIGTSLMAQRGASLICDLTYWVSMGPGHLSPLRFRSIDMQLSYAAAELEAITISAGGFTVRMLRQ